MEGVIAAGFGFVAAAAICYVFLRRTVYNFGDPLLFVTISIPFSSALFAFLCATRFVPWDKFLLFAVVLVSFLAGCRAATFFFGRADLRRAIVSCVNRLGSTEVYAILMITAVITCVLAYFSLVSGGQGDARQDFSRAFRPLVTLHSGLSLVSILVLLSPRLSTKQAWLWLFVLIAPSAAFSGKSVLLPVFYWFGLRYFVQERHAKATTIALLTLGIFLGVAIMGILAYGASSSSSVLLLIVTRLWLAGDVYLYAYQQNGLALARGDYHPSFLPYMFHPITTLVGIRGYDKPLGSVLASETLHHDVLQGPTPHLPVVLDFFFPDQFLTVIIISLVTGFLVMAIRPIGIWMAGSRSRYLALGGVTAAIFCPQAGFTDTSQVLILLVGVVGVSGCGALLEMLRMPRSGESLADRIR